MNKLLLPLALLLAASVAFAGHTIILNARPCGTDTYGGCTVNVGASGKHITLNWTQTGALKLTYYTHDPATNVNFASDVFSGSVGYPLTPGAAFFSNVPLIDASGVAVLITGGFNSARRCTVSGRAQHCTSYVIFTGGTLRD
ncbi:MAG TPA: hypothetical protein VGN77_02755 [Steroidobacteraceae bacterium]|nr:hypothetical protein [Steroidobacteraceae bacterium]